MLDDVHRNQLVRVALYGPAGIGWSISGFHFAFHHEGCRYVLRQEIEEPTAVTSPFPHTLVGPAWLTEQLYDANQASMQTRYDDLDDDFPGPKYLGYGPPAMTTVEALKAIACLDYQCCEYGGWKTSLAYSFVMSLRTQLIPQLPGYDEAPWDWHDETIRARRSIKAVP